MPVAFVCYDYSMTTTTRNKAAIDLYRDGGTEYPSVNVKVYGNIDRVPLPLELGMVSSDGGQTFETITTEPGFTHDWIDANVSERDMNIWWKMACQDGWEQAQAEADRLFPGKVTVYSAGRSGGHLIVDGLPPVDEWDAIAVTRWHRFADHVRLIVSDIPRAMVWLINANLYEPWAEEQEAEEGAELPVTLNV